MTFQNPDALVRNMDGYFIGRNDRIARLGMTISTFQNIPGLVGFWPMSSVQRSTGNAYDLSGQSRTLTYNGNPTYNIYNDIVPYIDLDGTGDFLSRADETDLDILGTETHNASGVRGLTFGGWFRPQVTGALQNVIGKSNDFNGPFLLAQDASDNSLFRVRNSADAANFQVIITDAFINTNVWSFHACRYIPSTELKLWENTNTNTNTTSIPASLLNGTDNFTIGALGGGSSPWDGDASLCFLSANALSDAYINALFQQSRIPMSLS